MIYPNRVDIKKFRFVSCDFDETLNQASLVYAFDDKITFEETFVFENAPHVSQERMPALKRCLKYLHLAAGVSYYKAFIPKEIAVETTTLSKDEADFFNQFYLSGLGEFSFKNNLNLQDIIKFPYEADYQAEKIANDFRLKEQPIVPVGGGKDSIVTIAALKNAGLKPVLFSVGFPAPIAGTVEIAGLKNIVVTRKIAKSLLELNQKLKECDAFNGHIPVTGVFAFLLAMSAVIYDFDAVLMSNERSANSENIVRDDGFLINHQWSKSFEFEMMFKKFADRYLLDNFKYFSFLRPLSELYIAKLFSRSQDFFDVFTSCNHAFAIMQENRSKGWCLNCDKCRFVYLALAPFIEKSRMIAIFGKDLLDDETQEKGFSELLGLSKYKPFECVGEIKECQAALFLLNQKPEWQSSYIVNKLAKQLNTSDTKMTKIVEDVLSLSKEHQIPEKYMEALNAYLRA
ncbi:MAG: endonuclease domain-containing protein [Alphaproteobacteria bacterium]